MKHHMMIINLLFEMESHMDNCRSVYKSEGGWKNGIIGLEKDVSLMTKGFA